MQRSFFIKPRLYKTCILEKTKAPKLGRNGALKLAVDFLAVIYLVVNRALSRALFRLRFVQRVKIIAALLFSCNLNKDNLFALFVRNKQQ